VSLYVAQRGETTIGLFLIGVALCRATILCKYAINQDLAPGLMTVLGLILLCKKTVITAKISDKIYGRNKCLVLAFFCQHYGRKFCRNFVLITVQYKVENSNFFHRDFYGQKI
jgi:hypothetical protein